MCAAWTELGYADTVAATITGHAHDRLGIVTPRTQAQLTAAGELPPWLGDEAFHRAHRSNLVRKNPEYYGPIFTDVPDDLEYVWPGG